MGQDVPQPGRCARAWKQSLILCTVVGVLYWLYGWRPFLIQAWTQVDEGLYLRQGEAFARWVTGTGRFWLGAWDSHLLAKAPLYGVWIGLIHLTGVPLRVAEFLLLIAGAWLFRRAVRPVRALRPWEFLVVLCLLACNPLLPAEIVLRRIGFQTTLSNLALIATLGLALRALASPGEKRRWAWASGFFFSLCYLNREEATWIAAAVAAACLLHGMTSFLDWRRERTGWRRSVKNDASTLLLFVLGAAPCILFVCTANRICYGTFTTTFRRSPALTAVYQRLTSLEPAGHQPYIPIARPTRMKAYDLSPTFAKMKPFLEGNTDYWHAGNEHAAMNGHTPDELEFFVSYFEFSLAWAAEKIGAKNGGEVEQIFRDIDRELMQAVRDKKIEAGRSGPSILAAPVAGDAGRLLSSFWISIRSLLFVNLAAYQPATGNASSSSVLDNVAQLIHAPVKLPASDSVQYKLRLPILNLIRRIQSVVYPLFFLLVPVLLIWKRKQAFTTVRSQRAVELWTTLVPVIGLAAFCFTMAVVNVLGFPFLTNPKMGGYNVLGFSPLSVLCAYTFTVLVASRRDQARPSLIQSGAP